MTETISSGEKMNVQSGWQITWRVVLAFDDVAALVDGFKQIKCISNTEDESQTTSQELAGWWTW